MPVTGAARWGETIVRRWLHLGAAGLLVLVAGCGGNEERRDAPPGLDSRTERLVARLWEASGGARSWKERSAVRFSYEISSGEGAPVLRLAEVGFRTKDARYVWVLPAGAKDLVRLDALGEPGSALRALEEARGPIPEVAAEERDLVDLSLRSIRYLFCLPLATTVGSWEFRALLAPPDVKVPPLIEVSPNEPGAPVRTCLLFLDDATSRLTDAIYVGRLPGGDRTFRLGLSGYERVGGIEVATARCHAPGRKDGDPRPARDPFAVEVPEEPPCAIRERVAEVAFLSAPEADARYPLPEAREEASGAAEGPSSGSRSGGVDGER